MRLSQFSRPSRKTNCCQTRVTFKTDQDRAPSCSFAIRAAWSGFWPDTRTFTCRPSAVPSTMNSCMRSPISGRNIGAADARYQCRRTSFSTDRPVTSIDTFGTAKFPTSEPPELLEFASPNFRGVLSRPSYRSTERRPASPSTCRTEPADVLRSSLRRRSSGPRPTGSSRRN